MKGFSIGSLKISLPIIQGGMGIGISLSGLASAVANMGGIGVISTVGIGIIGNKPYQSYRQVNIDALRVEIKKARELSNGVLGVNIMTALSNFADMVKTSIEEGIDIIFSGAGLPLDLPKYLVNEAKTKLVPIVSSARAAAIICKKWKQNFNYLPDAIVLEGPKAGGHLGYKKELIEDESNNLEKLLTEVIQELQHYTDETGTAIPVIAAGGIYTGEDIHRMLSLGAAAVQMGTRFVATVECDASDEFKKAYINATEKDVSIIKSPVGMPGRAILNNFFKEVEEGKKRPTVCRHHCILSCDFKTTPYCISAALVEAQMGNLDNGFAFAGSNVYRVDKITSVAELITSLSKEYNEALFININKSIVSS